MALFSGVRRSGLDIGTSAVRAAQVTRYQSRPFPGGIRSGCPSPQEPSPTVKSAIREPCPEGDLATVEASEVPLEAGCHRCRQSASCRSPGRPAFPLRKRNSNPRLRLSGRRSHSDAGRSRSSSTSRFFEDYVTEELIVLHARPLLVAAGNRDGRRISWLRLSAAGTPPVGVDLTPFAVASSR